MMLLQDVELSSSVPAAGAAEVIVTHYGSRRKCTTGVDELSTLDDDACTTRCSVPDTKHE
jgi:hypothetical protein